MTSTPGTYPVYRDAWFGHWHVRDQEDSVRTRDGRERFRDYGVETYFQYGTLTIARAEAIGLEHVRWKLDLVPTYTHEQSEHVFWAWREGLTLFFDEHDDPIDLFLQSFTDSKLPVERRLWNQTYRSYGHVEEQVTQAGGWTKETNWVYVEGQWTPDEQNELEAGLRTFVPTWTNNCWKLQKAPPRERAHRYFARRHSWEYGWIGGETIQELLAGLRT
jgi:hypothetical protein